MLEKIPDFNDTELWVIRQAVTERVRFKTGEQAYRNQFGTGRNEYTDLGECVTTLLPVQADHAAKRAADPNV